MRRLALLCLAAIAGLGIFWATRRGDRDQGAPRRGAPTVPTPTPEEKIRFFYKLFTSGEQTDIGGRRIPTWQKIGERALLDQGAPALDFLLSPDRYAEYQRSPNLVSNALRILPSHRDADACRFLYPFLLHFLDPPGPEGGGVSFRKPIFALFTVFPDKRAAPACVAELDRKKSGVDLRKEALIVLLKTGRTEAILKRYRTFDRAMRQYLLARLYEFADPRYRESYPGVAKAFYSRLDEARKSRDPFLRVYALGTLLRLGREGMQDALLEEYEKNDRAGASDPAWYAVRILAQDRLDPRAYRICLKEAAKQEPGLGRVVADEILFQHWIDRPEVARILWKRLESTAAEQSLDLRLLAALLRIDRPAVVAFLKRCILGDNPRRQEDAFRFVRTDRTIPEAGAWIIGLLRKATDSRKRAYLFQHLTMLRTKAAIPVLRAEFDDAPAADLRTVAALALIEFGDKPGLEKIGRRLREGDRELLQALLQRALGQGPAGVPEPLVADIVAALRLFPGQVARLEALYILRLRGRLEGVRDGMIDAYRREPSRRVANQIETAITELAYR